LQKSDGVVKYKKRRKRKPNTYSMAKEKFPAGETEEEARRREALERARAAQERAGEKGWRPESTKEAIDRNKIDLTPELKEALQQERREKDKLDKFEDEVEKGK